MDAGVKPAKDSHGSAVSDFDFAMGIHGCGKGALEAPLISASRFVLFLKVRRDKQP
jgi:hypothetical protein